MPRTGGRTPRPSEKIPPAELLVDSFLSPLIERGDKRVRCVGCGHVFGTSEGGAHVVRASAIDTPAGEACPTCTERILEAGADNENGGFR